ncbi:MAG: hypothetical protein WBN03_15890 [Desulfobacterales bacterium]|jgi:hypothetical protein
MDWNHDYANYLNEEAIKAIQELEKETGTVIMAYPTPPAPASLDKTTKQKIEALEKKLCVRLVAYEGHS